MLIRELACEGEMLSVLERLLADIGSDFCAVGLLAEQSGDLVWKLASGNLSDRYKTISSRAGRGLGGSVVKVGRGMTLHVTELIAVRQLHEYPILLAEKLRSAYAVPIQYEGKVLGVLLTGDRVKRIYRPEDKRSATAAGERIAGLLAAP